MASKAQKEKLAKAVKANNRRIARDNAAFEKMTPAEKRVQIARDVIAQLAVGRLVATPGMWLTGEDEAPLFDEDAKPDTELQAILKQTATCEGCALGGMFMCAVERADKLKISKLDGDGLPSEENVFSYMRRFFTAQQLDWIESAFEQGNGMRPGTSDSINFVMDVEEPSDRMRLIMENIVVNKGKFVPNQRPVQVWRTPGFLG